MLLTVVVTAAQALLWMAAPPVARAQREVVEVRVRPGDTCRGIAQRVYGDPDAYDLIHAENPGLGPPPHELTPGTVLRMPAPAPPARVTALERRVERRAPDSASFDPARLGQALARGTLLRTHEASSAELTFADRGRVSVRERTLVVVIGGAQRLRERPVTRAELERGALRSRLAELAGRRPLEVDTPQGRATLDGAAVVSVEEDGTSRVANHGQRAAVVEANGQRVSLPAGTGTVLRRGAPPSRPARLLPAPRWLADVRGAVIGFAGRGATLRGGFSPVRGAGSYRVEISRQPEGEELVGTLELDADAREFAYRGAPEGTLYASVASIDRHGLEGRRSPWRAFSVRHARLVEPGGGAPETERGDDAPPRVWPGTWVVAPRGFTCALDDGEVGAILTLAGPGRADLRCEDAAGYEAERLAIDVVPVAPRAAAEARLVRGRTSGVRLRFDAEHEAPGRALLVDGEGGARVVRREVEPDGALWLDVWTPPEHARPVRLTVAVAAGVERVPLGAVEVPTVPFVPATGDVEIAPPRGSRPAPLRPVTAALGDLPLPGSLGLRDERRGGYAAWLTGAAVAREGLDEPQVRLGIGARAELPGTPASVGFATQVDALGEAVPIDRRGSADLLAGLGVRLVDEGAFGLGVDLSAWFPTRPEPESLGRVRLAPSVEGSLRPAEWLALRARQGAIVDAADEGARLWASALGVDVAPLEWLALGLELDSSVGRFADRDGAAFGVGLAAELHLDAFELAAGVRFGLGDEGRALLGEWAATLSVRVYGGTARGG